MSKSRKNHFNWLEWICKPKSKRCYRKSANRPKPPSKCLTRTVSKLARGIGIGLVRGLNLPKPWVIGLMVNLLISAYFGYGLAQRVGTTNTKNYNFVATSPTLLENGEPDEDHFYIVHGGINGVGRYNSFPRGYQFLQAEKACLDELGNRAFVFNRLRYFRNMDFVKKQKPPLYLCNLWLNLPTKVENPTHAIALSCNGYDKFPKEAWLPVLCVQKPDELINSNPKCDASCNVNVKPPPRCSQDCLPKIKCGKRNCDPNWSQEYCNRAAETFVCGGLCSSIPIQENDFYVNLTKPELCCKNNSRCAKGTYCDTATERKCIDCPPTDKPEECPCANHDQCASKICNTTGSDDDATCLPNTKCEINEATTITTLGCKCTKNEHCPAAVDLNKQVCDPDRVDSSTSRLDGCFPCNDEIYNQKRVVGCKCDVHNDCLSKICHTQQNPVGTCVDAGICPTDPIKSSVKEVQNGCICLKTSDCPKVKEVEHGCDLARLDPSTDKTDGCYPCKDEYYNNKGRPLGCPCTAHKDCDTKNHHRCVVGSDPTNKICVDCSKKEMEQSFMDQSKCACTDSILDCYFNDTNTYCPKQIDEKDKPIGCKQCPDEDIEKPEGCACDKPNTYCNLNPNDSDPPPPSHDTLKCSKTKNYCVLCKPQPPGLDVKITQDPTCGTCLTTYGNTFDCAENHICTNNDICEDCKKIDLTTQLKTNCPCTAHSQCDNNGVTRSICSKEKSTCILCDGPLDSSIPNPCACGPTTDKMNSEIGTDVGCRENEFCGPPSTNNPTGCINCENVNEKRPPGCKCTDHEQCNGWENNRQICNVDTCLICDSASPPLPPECKCKTTQKEKACLANEVCIEEKQIDDLQATGCVSCKTGDPKPTGCDCKDNAECDNWGMKRQVCSGKICINCDKDPVPDDCKCKTAPEDPVNPVCGRNDEVCVPGHVKVGVDETGCVSCNDNPKPPGCDCKDNTDCDRWNDEKRQKCSADSKCISCEKGTSYAKECQCTFHTGDKAYDSLAVGCRATEYCSLEKDPDNPSGCVKCDYFKNKPKPPGCSCEIDKHDECDKWEEKPNGKKIKQRCDPGTETCVPCDTKYLNTGDTLNDKCSLCETNHECNVGEKWCQNEDNCPDATKVPFDDSLVEYCDRAGLYGECIDCEAIRQRKKEKKLEEKVPTTDNCKDCLRDDHCNPSVLDPGETKLNCVVNKCQDCGKLVPTTHIKTNCSCETHADCDDVTGLVTGRSKCLKTGHALAPESRCVNCELLNDMLAVAPGCECTPLSKDSNRIGIDVGCRDMEFCVEPDKDIPSSPTGCMKCKDINDKKPPGCECDKDNHKQCDNWEDQRQICSAGKCLNCDSKSNSNPIPNECKCTKQEEQDFCRVNEVCDPDLSSDTQTGCVSCETPKGKPTGCTCNNNEECDNPQGPRKICSGEKCINCDEDPVPDDCKCKKAPEDAKDPGPVCGRKDEVCVPGYVNGNDKTGCVSCDVENGNPKPPGCPCTETETDHTDVCDGWNDKRQKCSSAGICISCQCPTLKHIEAYCVSNVIDKCNTCPKLTTHELKKTNCWCRKYGDPRILSEQNDHCKDKNKDWLCTIPTEERPDGCGTCEHLIADTCPCKNETECLTGDDDQSSRHDALRCVEKDGQKKCIRCLARVRIEEGELGRGRLKSDRFKNREAKFIFEHDRAYPDTLTDTYETNPYQSWYQDCPGYGNSKEDWANKDFKGAYCLYDEHCNLNHYCNQYYHTCTCWAPTCKKADITCQPTEWFFNADTKPYENGPSGQADFCICQDDKSCANGKCRSVMVLNGNELANSLQDGIKSTSDPDIATVQQVLDKFKAQNPQPMICIPKKYPYPE